MPSCPFSYVDDEAMQTALMLAGAINGTLAVIAVEKPDFVVPEPLYCNVRVPGALSVAPPVKVKLDELLVRVIAFAKLPAMTKLLAS